MRTSAPNEGSLYENKNEATKRQQDIYGRLRERTETAAPPAKDYSPIPDGRRGAVDVSLPGQPYQHPNEGERRKPPVNVVGVRA